MKKTLAIVMLLGFGLIAAGFRPPPAASSAASDEDAIKARSASFAAAWNKHDAVAMASHWASDGDLITPWGRVCKGHAAVELMFKEEQEGAGIMKASTYEQKFLGFRLLNNTSPATAIVEWEATLVNVKAADGSAHAPMPHHVTIVMQKNKDGKWMFEAARPFVIAPAPDADTPPVVDKKPQMHPAK